MADPDSSLERPYVAWVLSNLRFPRGQRGFQGTLEWGAHLRNLLESSSWAPTTSLGLSPGLVKQKLST